MNATKARATEFCFNKTTTFAFGSIFTILAGCVPATGFYYRVSSQVGTVQGYCSDLGPPVALKLKRGDVFVNIHDVHVNPILEGRQAFSLDVHMPSKVDVVRFAWNQLAAIDDATGKTTPMQIHNVNALNLPYGRVTRETFKSDSALYGQLYNDYSFEFQFKMGGARHFTIHFPDMWVNDVRYPGFDIDYELGHGIFLRC